VSAPLHVTVPPVHEQPSWLEHVPALSEPHGVTVPVQALVDDQEHGWCAPQVVASVNWLQTGIVPLQVAAHPQPMPVQFVCVSWVVQAVPNDVPPHVDVALSHTQPVLLLQSTLSKMLEHGYGVPLHDPPAVHVGQYVVPHSPAFPQSRQVA
jgi:hypothetical protein